MKHLLSDPRTDSQTVLNTGITLLWGAAHCGHMRVVEFLMTTGIDLGLDKRSILGLEGWNNTTAAETAWSTEFHPFFRENEEIRARRVHYGPLIARLIDDFAEDAHTVRHRLRSLPEHRGVCRPAFFFFPNLFSRLH